MSRCFVEVSENFTKIGIGIAERVIVLLAQVIATKQRINVTLEGAAVPFELGLHPERAL